MHILELKLSQDMRKPVIKVSDKVNYLNLSCQLYCWNYAEKSTRRLLAIRQNYHKTLMVQCAPLELKGAIVHKKMEKIAPFNSKGVNGSFLKTSLFTHIKR